jgi:hypothetical protein
VYCSIPCLTWRRKAIQFPKCCALNTGRWTKSRNSVILIGACNVRIVCWYQWWNCRPAVRNCECFLRISVVVVVVGWTEEKERMRLWEINWPICAWTGFPVRNARLKCVSPKTKSRTFSSSAKSNDEWEFSHVWFQFLVYMKYSKLKDVTFLCSTSSFYASAKLSVSWRPRVWRCPRKASTFSLSASRPWLLVKNTYITEVKVIAKLR